MRGKVAKILRRVTDIAGSSDVLMGGAVTYSNAAKTDLVGVPAVLFSRLVTGPLSVVIAYFASFGLYSSSN